jgi:hypothetical protein
VQTVCNSFVHSTKLASLPDLSLTGLDAVFLQRREDDLVVNRACVLPVSATNSGKLADMYRRRRACLIALAGSIIFGGLSALSWCAGSLIAFRTISAIFGSATGPAGIAIIAEQYTGPARAEVVGWWIMASAVRHCHISQLTVCAASIDHRAVTDYETMPTFYLGLPSTLLLTLRLWPNLTPLPIEAADRCDRSWFGRGVSDYET